MKDPKFSSRIHILPWVGKRYCEGGPFWEGGPKGKRLLILGESHYAGSEEGLEADRTNRCLTRDVIERQWSGESYAYHTKVAGAVTGKEPHVIDKKAFWSTVAFYSFVQDIVSVGARTRPTAAHWARGLQLLPEVLEALRPHYVLATGRQLWTNLLDWKQDREIAFRGKQFETCADTTSGGHPFRAGYITHPSAPGFGSGTSWHPLVRAFLASPSPAPASSRARDAAAKRAPSR